MRFFITIITFSLLLSCKDKPNEVLDYSKLESIPTKNEVGYLLLPENISPLSAPFGMPEFKKPTFPERSIKIKDNRVSPEDLVTKSIQNAIDKINGLGGGTVIVPKGTWKTGRISLKSNVNLHFEDGAILEFSTNVKDYQPAVFNRIESLEVMSLAACIYANNQENIAITGKGLLIGPYSGEIKERSYTKPIEGLIDLTKPATDRIHDGSKEDWILPPKFISPINCKNVFIEGISLKNTAFWNIVPTYCENVIIRGVYINSYGVPRGDGINIESSKNVLIEYCTLNTGDDCITMKAGRGEDGLKVNKSTENIVVRYCLTEKGHGGITCGSETAGVIRNLYVHDCVFDGTVVGIRFKTRRPRGGGGENLHYDRIRMNLEATAIKWDMLGTPAYVGELAERLPIREINKLTPFYRNISISNVIIEKSAHFLKVFGIPESPLENLKIQNIKAKSSKLIIINDAKNVSIKNVEIETEDNIVDVLGGKTIVLEDVFLHTDATEISYPTEKIKTSNFELGVKRN